MMRMLRKTRINVKQYRRYAAAALAVLLLLAGSYYAHALVQQIQDFRICLRVRAQVGI